MGKSKTRIFRKGKNDQITNMSRNKAIDDAAKFLNENNISDALDLITMFGLTAEEVLEAGAEYEAVIAIRNMFTQ